MSLVDSPANLCMLVLQLFDLLDGSCRPATTFAPLIFVLGVSMVKELIEDVKRWLADREINARLVLVFTPDTGTFVDKRWRDIKVCISDLSTFCTSHLSTVSPAAVVQH